LLTIHLPCFSSPEILQATQFHSWNLIVLTTPLMLSSLFYESPNDLISLS